MLAKYSNKLILFCFSVSLAGIFMNLVWDAINPPGVASPMFYNLLVGAVMAIFTFLHSARYFGRDKAIFFFLTTALISFLMEYFGVLNGDIYGAYHYGSSHGPKALDTVPYIIPLSWFMFIYPAIIITNELLNNAVRQVKGRKAAGWLLWIVVFAALDSLIATSLDVLIDPIWTSKGAWVWTEVDSLRNEDIFYKIPVQNYFGWLLTTFIIFFLFRVVFFNTDSCAYKKDGLYYLPVINFIAIFAVGTLQVWFFLKSPGVTLVSIMTMGLISLVALANMLQHFSGAGQESEQAA